MFGNARDILMIIGPVLGILATGIPLLIGLIRKTKKLIKERNWNKIMEILPSLIVEAEKLANYRGQEKKEYVKSRLAVYSVKNKIAFDEARFEAAIDDIVRLTREVNKRDKDKFLQAQQQVDPHSYAQATFVGRSSQIPEMLVKQNQNKN